MNSPKYFILFDSCQIIRGYKRCILIDYSHDLVYTIPEDYFNLIKKLNRNSIDLIREAIDDNESRLHFDDFISIMISQGLAFITETPDSFPPVSNDLNDDYIIIQNAIVEVNPETFSWETLQKIFLELKELNCPEIQLRFLGRLDCDLLDQIVNEINKTEALYLEVHSTYDEQINSDRLHQLIDKNAILTNLYLYDAPHNSKKEIINDIPDFVPISLGNIFYIEESFTDGNCCGIITLENLDFSSSQTNRLLKQKNGCLYKKISIDQYGNIKNCPSMTQIYGNIETSSLRSVISDLSFTRWWDISKDSIKICKDCEYRYNCTDCRAFLSDPEDTYSKPAKCSYNPYNCTWN